MVSWLHSNEIFYVYRDWIYNVLRLRENLGTGRTTQMESFKVIFILFRIHLSVSTQPVRTNRCSYLSWQKLVTRNNFPWASKFRQARSCQPKHGTLSQKVKMVWCVDSKILNSSLNHSLNLILFVFVARKLGCSIILLPEDIMEVNHCHCMNACLFEFITFICNLWINS